MHHFLSPCSLIYHLSLFYRAMKDFCRGCLSCGAEGDGTDWPLAWHIAPGFPGRYTLSWIFWHFCRGGGRGMGDDGGAWLPSPIASVWALFVGTHIHVAVPSKQQNPFDNVRGEWPQNNSKIYLADDLVHLWLGRSGGASQAQMWRYFNNIAAG